MTDDGVYAYEYNMDPEETSVGPGPMVLNQIGVFCHEFGHTLGLPDLYDTDYSSSGIGGWSVMAGGSYNGNSAKPAHFDAWCKWQLGWVTPENISSNKIAHEFPQVETSGYVARLWTNGWIREEFFLIENRQKIGFDEALPGEGLFIWHIDQSRWNNTVEYKYLVGLEQADGLFQLESRPYINGDAGDPYPGSTNNREFSESTLPGSFTNDTSTFTKLPDTTYIAVWNISDSDSLMTANLDVNYTRPKYELLDYSFAEISGDGNETPDPGDTYGLYVELTNFRSDAEDVTIYTSFDNDTIVVYNPEQIIGDLPATDTLDNAALPIRFFIPPEMKPTIVNITFKICDPTESDSIIITKQMNLGVPSVLIVDQDGGIHNYQAYYTNIFDTLKIPYDYYDHDLNGTPGSEYSNYPIIIWYSSVGFLTSSDVSFLSDYLDGGGNLFLNGQDIGDSLAVSPDSLFLKNYLKVSYDRSGRGYDDIYGVDGSLIGADSIVLKISVGDGSNNQKSMDVFTDIDPSATPCLAYLYTEETFKGYGGILGLRV